MPPANDDFANRITLAGDAGTWSGNDDGATSETGEPSPYAGSGGASIWFEWTPGFTGIAQVDTIGSTYDMSTSRLDTVVDVFTGSTITGLTFVAGNDDDPSGANGYNSRCRFACTSGTTYVIRVNGYGSSDTGDVIVNWSQHIPAPPPTISSISPTTATYGDNIVITGTNFVDVTDVRFRYEFSATHEWLSATSYTVDSPTQITVQVPASGSGVVTGPIQVITDTGDAVSPGLVVTGTMGVTAVTPGTSWEGGIVEVEGSGFTGLSSVDLVGTSSYGVPDYTIVSDSLLHFTVPSGISQITYQIALDTTLWSYQTLDVVDPTTSPPTADCKEIIFLGASNDSGASPAPVVPAAVGDDDLLVLAVLQDHPSGSTPGLTLPSGWTTIVSHDTYAMTLSYKYWHTGDPTTITVTPDNEAVAVLGAWRGIDDSQAPDHAIRAGDPVHFVDGSPFDESTRTLLYVVAVMIYGQDSGMAPDAPLLSTAAMDDGLSTGGNALNTGKEVRMAYVVDVADGDIGPFTYSGYSPTIGNEGEALCALFVSVACPTGGWSIGVIPMTST